MKSFARLENFPLSRPFSIARGVRTHQAVLVVEVMLGGHRGTGAASPLVYAGETGDSILQDAVRLFGENNAAPMRRQTLLRTMHAGAARAAIDAALWDLEASLGETSCARLSGLQKPAEKVEIAATIGLDHPGAMAQAAMASASGLLKVKLGGSAGDEERRIFAVREARPDARLVADVNGGWTRAQLDHLAPLLAAARYELLEQPLPRGEEQQLEGYHCPLALCLDESIATLADFEAFSHLCDVVNIKLEKAGGLTHALELAAYARRVGKRIFIGCMVGSAVATAPALILAQGADYADLDGPLWLAEDIARLHVEGNCVLPVISSRWGDYQPR